MSFCPKHKGMQSNRVEAELLGELLFCCAGLVVTFSFKSFANEQTRDGNHPAIAAAASTWVTVTVTVTCKVLLGCYGPKIR